MLLERLAAVKMALLVDLEEACGLRLVLCPELVPGGVVVVAGVTYKVFRAQGA